MALQAGTRLGSYEILTAIGAGGMGEVYRAHDARLRRDVAIKVLPASVSTDADRLRRFEQEALATAALNHPNILAVFDVGREGTTAFVVEELLEGETLREKLAVAPPALPVRKVVDYAIQIANGLAAAHEKGIVHRDLKPENVFVTGDERVKILDFGLAKTVAPATSAAATELVGATEPGVVLGTIGYMAPEQVRAQPIDHRADIFSLGTLLYEMLSGRRAFHGDTTADTMTAILKETPPELAETGRAIPPALDRVVSRCLEKNPARRFQSASDLAFALQSLSTDSRVGSGAVVAAAPPVGRRMPRLLPVALALVGGIALGAIAIGLWRSPGDAVAADRIRFTISMSDGVGVDDLTRGAISPDGRFLALTEASVNGRQVTLHSLRDGSRRVMGDVSGPGSVCWSPDGRWLVYFGVDRALHKVEVATGQRQRLAPLVWAPNSASWSATGDIFVISAAASTVLVVPSGGGTPRELTSTAEATPGWLSVQALPDGKRLLLSRNPRDPEMVIVTIDGSQPIRVLGRGAYPHFLEPDNLVALRANQIVVWRTALDGSALTGEPDVLADGVLVRIGVNMMPFTATSNVLVFRGENQESRTRVAWFDRKGVEGTALAIRQHCRNPEFAPDYGRVALECWESTGGRDIWVYDLSRDVPARLTTDPSDDADPVWLDGQTILFASSRLGPADVFKTGAGGGRPEELVVKTVGATPTMGISPDGKDLILLTTDAQNTGLDLATYRLDGSGAAATVPLLKGPASEIEGQISPDGKHLLYASNQSGRYEVYVEPLPRTGERSTVSTDGGTDARWRPDGQEILYLSADRRLMAVPVRTAGGFSVGRAVELFRTRVAGPLGTGHRFPFAIAKDGQRLLMYVTDPASPPPGVTVIANWR